MVKTVLDARREVVAELNYIAEGEVRPQKLLLFQNAFISSCLLITYA